MKRLGSDNGAFILNIGWLALISYAVITVCSISVYLHHADLLQDTFMASVYSWSWLIFGLCIGFSVASKITDARICILLMGIACSVWYFVVMG
ncbi:MAG: hypothetical protein SA339_08345 [Methanomassiliicoccus sp.]|nr:hypothetical protein [Methanomassiliicoccus sp.]